MVATRIDDGETLQVVASTARTSGDVILYESDTYGIAADTAASGAEYRAFIVGTFELAKNTGVNLSVGEDLYWDATPGELTTNATNGTRIGVVARAATTLASKGRVVLNHPNVQLAPQT